MLLILISTLFICLLIWDYFFKRRRNQLLKSSGIPGPSPTLPLIGDIFATIGNDSRNVFKLFDYFSSLYGKVYRIWGFHRLLMVVKDPKYFEVILSSQSIIKKPFVYDMFSCWLGDGLLLSSGSKWHSRRKVLTPTYHFKILDGYIEIFDRQSSTLVQKLQKHADGKTVVNIFPYICLTALDIISETAMGVKINAQDNPDFPYAKAVKSATHILGNRVVKPDQYLDVLFLLTSFPSYLKLKKSTEIMHDFTNKVINDRRATLEHKNKTNDTTGPQSEDTSSNDVGQKKRMAFLDVLLQTTIDGKPLDNKEIREEVDTFMFEGHDTTTSAISFCLYLLARHPDEQQKVFEEILQVIGKDKEAPVTMRNLQDLKYLEAVIKESLRLYPSVPMIGRVTEQDVTIDGKIIPANTNICLLVYAAGRDPDYFSNPDDFRPERYYNELPDKNTTFAYVPFSAGPRNCIGQKFAMLELKSTISKVIRHYELLPLGPDVVQIMSVILRSESGINLGLKLRKY